MTIYVIVITLMILISLLYTLSYIFSKNSDSKFNHLAHVIREAVGIFAFWQSITILTIGFILSLILWYMKLQSAGIMILLGCIYMILIGFYHMYLSTYINVSVAKVINRGIIPSFMKALLANSASSVLLHCLSMAIVIFFNKFICFYNTLFFIGGVCLSSFMIRVTGGVFTKSADMGADLLGKLEMDLNEDDERNPLVKADNAGDMVGDAQIAATGLVESWILFLFAAIHLLKNHNIYIISLISIAVSYLMTYTFNISLKSMDILPAISTYFTICGISIIGLVFGFKLLTGPSLILFIIGMFSVFSLIIAAYRFTSGCSVVKVAKLTQNGVAMSIVGGLSEGYLAVSVFTLLIIIMMLQLYLCGFNINNLIYIIMGMISVSPAILILDNVGPVMDTAAGMIEACEPEHRNTADILDRVGNTTKALTKVYGVVLVILLMIIWLSLLFPSATCNILSISFWTNILIGISFASFSTYLSLNSVSDTAFNIIEYTRDKLKTWGSNVQLSHHMEVVSQLTKNSILTIFKPLILFTIMPIINFMIYSSLKSISIDLLTVQTIIGVFIFAIITGINMIISGSLWDNVKKHIELKGDKNKPIYKQAVIADTIGDPFKDTTGPFLIGLIKFVPFLLAIVNRIIFK